MVIGVFLQISRDLYHDVYELVEFACDHQSTYTETWKNELSSRACTDLGRLIGGSLQYPRRRKFLRFQPDATR